MFFAMDLGGSATKAVLLSEDGAVLSSRLLPPERTNASVERQAAACLSDRPEISVKSIAITGVWASFLSGNLLGINTCKVEEFHALSRGALSLSGQAEGLIVSMGTGTAFLYAGKDGSVRHLGGTGVGGGTLSGLGRLLTGSEDTQQLCALASKGDLSRVDLRMGDMALSSVATLPPELTASNFGKLSENASPGDAALGLINLVLQTIGTMAIFSCQAASTHTILLTGGLAALPQAADTWALFESVYPYRFIVPPHAAFATAIGAGRSLM